MLDWICQKKLDNESDHYLPSIRSHANYQATKDKIQFKNKIFKYYNKGKQNLVVIVCLCASQLFGGCDSKPSSW